MWDQLGSPPPKQSEIFKNAFDSVGKTRKEIAIAIGTHPEVLRKYVTGEIRFRTDVMERVLEKMGDLKCDPLHMEMMKQIKTYKGRRLTRKVKQV